MRKLRVKFWAMLQHYSAEFSKHCGKRAWRVALGSKGHSMAEYKAKLERQGDE